MFLCIVIEAFRLFAALHHAGLKPIGAICIVDQNGRIIETNAAALSKGVEQGMPVARAMGRSPTLRILNISEAGERNATHLLHSLASRIAPRVELTCPGMAIVALPPNFSDSSQNTVCTGVLTPQNLADKVSSFLKDLALQGFYARVGCASTPDWAELTARATPLHSFKWQRNRHRMRQLLDSLPLTAIPDWHPQTPAILQNWGIRNLGAFARLRQQDVAERLGPEAAQIHRRLGSQTPRPIHPSPVPPLFEQCCELEDPVEILESLSFILHRHTHALTRELQKSGLMARSVTLRLQLDRSPDHLRTIELPEPTCDPGRIDRLLLNHLQQQRLAAPVKAVQLSVQPVEPVNRQAGLFQQSVRNPWQLADTLDQLAAILSDNTFGSPRPANTHRPGVFHWEQLPETFDRNWHPGKDKGPPSFGPCWKRLTDAIPVTLNWSSGRPTRIQSRLVSGPVTEARGPWIVDGNWWDNDAWQLQQWDIAVPGQGLFRVATPSTDQPWMLVACGD